MIEELAGSIKLGWWIEKDGGAPAVARAMKPRELRKMYDRLENALASAISQTVDVYIDGPETPPVRIMFDVGGKEIEIEDGPVNGTLEDLRAEIGG